MKKEIIKSLLFWLSAEAVFIAVFVMQGSVLALFAFFAMLFLAVGSFGTCFFVRDKISVKTVLPPTAEKGKEIGGKIVFENRSVLPVFKSVCKIVIKNRLTGEENEIDVALSVPAKGKNEAEFSVSSEHCGYITVKVEKIVLTDIFGFIPLSVKNFSSAKAKATVLPDTFMPVIVFDGLLPVPEDSESYSPDKKGYDFSETFQIREYAEGDSMKQIHWKLSEKLDRTIVRDPSLPIAKNILLFWDKTVGTATSAETDAMAEVTASVAQSLCRSGYEFMLGWNDGNRIETAQIKSPDDLLEAIPRLIKFSAEPSEEKGAGELFSSFGKIICIAKGIPQELSAHPGASLLICDKGASVGGAIAFGAENYAEELEFLEFAT